MLMIQKVKDGWLLLVFEHLQYNEVQFCENKITLLLLVCSKFHLVREAGW